MREGETEGDKQIAKRDMQKNKSQRSNSGAGGVNRRSTYSTSAWMGQIHVRDGKGTIGHGVREATVRLGCDPRHVSWMTIPCPRAATGDDCPASPQGVPLTPLLTHTNTHALLPRDLPVDEQYG